MPTMNSNATIGSRRLTNPERDVVMESLFREKLNCWPESQVGAKRILDLGAVSTAENGTAENAILSRFPFVNDRGD